MCLALILMYICIEVYCIIYGLLFFCFCIIAACNPADLGENPTFGNSSGTATTTNGVIEYTGVVFGSVSHLKCNSGYTAGINSSNRTCMSNGNWSGKPPICLPAEVLSCEYDGIWTAQP